MALSRRSKLLFILIGAPLALIAIVLIAALTPAVQTFAARKVLAGQGGDVERVAVGFGGASLAGLRLTQPGLNVTVPSFRADAPLIDLAGGKIDVRALVAKDLVVEINPDAMQAASKPAPPAPPQEPAKPFDGVLNAVQLPELRVDGLDLSGRVRVLGAQPVDATFALTGGGIRAGQAGQLILKVEAKAGLGSVVTTFTLAPTLGADGRLDALGAMAEAFATSKLLAQPAKLRAKIDITRQGSGEAYGVSLLAGESPLVELDTRWAPGASELPGRWKIAVSDRDLAPFAMGLALPSFRLSGGGDLALIGTDRARVGGALDIAADGLEALGLPKLGPIALATKFGVEAGAKEARVESLQLDLKGATPVLAVQTLQPFAVALDTKKLSPARAGADLAAITLLGVPAEWLKLFVPDLTLAGSVTGAWTARPEGDGFAMVSARPFIASGVTYSSQGKPLVSFDAVRVEDLAVKQTSAGLAVAIGRVRVVADGADLLTLQVDATQAPGAPMQAKGELSALLAKLADQPLLRGQTRLSAGQAAVAFDASVADVLKASAKVRLTGLRAAGAGDLPEVAFDAEVARDASGVLSAKLPLTVRNAKAGRVSDLALQATVTPGPADTNIVARLASQVLHIEDLQTFAALAAAKPAPASSPAKPAAVAPESVEKSSAAAPAGPLWAGTTGDIELALDRVVYAPGIEVTSTRGRFTLTRETASIQALQTLLGTGGSVNVSGGLRWLPASKDYSLGAEVKGSGVAVGPLLKVLAPSEAAKLEGTYDLSARVAGQGGDPAAAATGAAAELKLTGRQGVIRAINLETNKYAKVGSAVSGLVGLAGALSGNAELSQRGAQLAALNSVARAFANLAYDEIAIEAKRAADGSVEVGRISLLSPQLKLAGSGGLRAVPGRSFADMPLNLRLDLGARGELADNLSALRVLAPATDGAVADSYAALVEPIVLDGTLKQVGTAQASRLLSRALGL